MSYPNGYSPFYDEVSPFAPTEDVSASKKPARRPAQTKSAERSPPPSPATVASAISSRRSSHFDVILGTTPQSSSAPFAASPLTGSTVPAKRQASASPPVASRVAVSTPFNAQAGPSHTRATESNQTSALGSPTSQSRVFLFPSSTDPFRPISAASSFHASPAGEAGPSRSRTSTPSSFAGTTGPPSPSSLPTTDGSSRKRARPSSDDHAIKVHPSHPLSQHHMGEPHSGPSHLLQEARAPQLFSPSITHPAISPLPAAGPAFAHNSSASATPSGAIDPQAPASSVEPDVSIAPAADLIPLPPAFATETPASHLPFVVPFPPPFNSTISPFVPTLRSSLQTSLLPLMQPDERKIAMELEMLPVAYLRLKEDVLAVLRLVGGDKELAKDAVSGWKGGMKKGRMGRRDGALIVLEFLIREAQNPREPTSATSEANDRASSAKEATDGLETSAAAPASVHSALSDAPVRTETDVGVVADVSAALSVSVVKGKAKETAPSFGLSNLAYGIENRAPDAYSLWVFLQGYAAAGDVEQADIKAVVRPLTDIDRAAVIADIRTVLPPWPRPPRKSGKPRREPKTGPFGQLDRTLSPVAPLPTAISAFHAAWLQSTGDQPITPEQQARFERLQSQLARSEEAQREREARWMESRRNGMPSAGSAAATPSPKMQRPVRVPAAKRRRMEMESVAAVGNGKQEWIYEIEEASEKTASGYALTLKSTSSLDPSVSTSQVITLNSFTAMLATVKADIGKIVFETYQSSPLPHPTPLFNPSDLALFPSLSTIFLHPLPTGSKNPSVLFKPSSSISPVEMEAFYPAMFHAVERRWKEEGRVRDLLMLNVLYKTCQVKRSAMRKGGRYVVGRGVGSGEGEAGEGEGRKRMVGVGRGNGRRSLGTPGA